MEKSKYVRVIEVKKVRGDDPIEYFPHGVRKYVLSLRRGDAH